MSPQIQDLLLALAKSSLPAARVAEPLVRAGQLNSEVSGRMGDDGVRVLRSRINVKDAQIEAIEDPVERARLVDIRDALRAAVTWIDVHPSGRLRIESLCGEPDLIFTFYRNDVSGEIISGFESRDARRLTLERGRAFWGSSWRPPRSGN
jgi:hypothetical protein